MEQKKNLPQNTLKPHKLNSHLRIAVLCILLIPLHNSVFVIVAFLNSTLNHFYHVYIQLDPEIQLCLCDTCLATFRALWNTKTRLVSMSRKASKNKRANCLIDLFWLETKYSLACGNYE